MFESYLNARAVDAERLVFVDEMGANVSLSPLYAWSRRWLLRAHAKALRKWGKNLTLLASITDEGVGPCSVVEGPTTYAITVAQGTPITLRCSRRSRGTR